MIFGLGVKEQGIYVDIGHGEGLAGLHNSIYDGSGTCTVAQACKDIDTGFAGVSRTVLATSPSVVQGINIS